MIPHVRLDIVSHCQGGSHALYPFDLPACQPQSAMVVHGADGRQKRPPAQNVFHNRIDKTSCHQFDPFLILLDLCPVFETIKTGSAQECKTVHASLNLIFLICGERVIEHI
jgi:hypothetical protein